MKKNLVAAVLTVAMVATMLTACGSKDAAATTTASTAAASTV